MSEYLNYLPAVFQEGDRDGRLSRLLLAFQHVLTGVGKADDPGLEELLDGVIDPATGSRLATGIERYYDPGLRPGRTFAAATDCAPPEFLEWLSGWVAISLRPDMTETQRRELIACAVPLYRVRGTLRGLERLVEISTGLHVTINDAVTRGAPALDRDDEKRPLWNRFDVLVQLPYDVGRYVEDLRRKRELLTAIIDREKPAHTWYTLRFETTVLQIGKHSTIGVDTLIGAPDYRDDDQ
jgi:hypothetical protein